MRRGISSMKKEQHIRFGVARACINPTRPVSLAGYFNERHWTQVLDDLEVRALVLQSRRGAPLSAIVQFDLLEVSPPLVACFKEEMRRAFGPQDALVGRTILEATHTHTAPLPAVEGNGCDPQFIPDVAAIAVKTVRKALDDMREGELCSGMAGDSRFCFNRRYWMKDGGVLTNPGKLNPGIVRPEGDVDPEIPLAVIRRNGQPQVVLASISNHGDTIGGNGVSADWMGACHRAVEATLPQGGMMMPLIGASGNINHFDVRTRRNQTCYAESQRIGQGYAESIIRVLQTPGALKPVPVDEVRFACRQVTVYGRSLFADELAENQEVLARFKDIPLEMRDGKTPDFTSEDLVRRTPVVLKFFALKAMQQHAAKGQHWPMTIAGIRLGGVVVASLPCETFVEIGLFLRKGIFAADTCLVASHAFANPRRPGGGGYIPNAWNYHRGGYETHPRSNPFEPDTAERLLRGWRRLAAELKP